MFGKDILPTTKWDRELNRKHEKPDFQPLEYLISGLYISEIVRLIIVDAVRDANLFDGQLPQGLDTPYAFDASLMAILERCVSMFIDLVHLLTEPQRCHYFTRKIRLRTTKSASSF